jgi:hypothetical protein
MSSAADRPTFLIRLRPGPHVADPIRALKAGLKRLGRDHDLQCLSAEVEPPIARAPSPPACAQLSSSAA